MSPPERQVLRFRLLPGTGSNVGPFFPPTTGIQTWKKIKETYSLL